MFAMMMIDDSLLDDDDYTAALHTDGDAADMI